MDRLRIYDIMYALAAIDGREEVLFGSSGPLAREAFERSLAGTSFPILWFELPLLGDPWFDLHVNLDHQTTTPNMTFTPEETGGNPEVFQWFVQQGSQVRELALSWDTGVGNVQNPAMQLLLARPSLSTVEGFLQAAGKPQIFPAARQFLQRVPRSWFACYVGIFPARAQHFLRVECIPQPHTQHQYAQDTAFLRNDLLLTGISESALSDSALERCCMLANSPFPIEFQFDVNDQGAANATFSASIRFSHPMEEDTKTAFLADGAAGDIMRSVQEWGLADDRWHLLQDLSYAKRLTSGEKSIQLNCHPAFLKLRWRDGQPVDAKVYLLACVQ